MIRIIGANNPVEYNTPKEDCDYKHVDTEEDTKQIEVE